MKDKRNEPSMKTSRTPVKYNLGIPVGKLVQGIIFLLLCVVLLVVEIRYHHAKPGEAAIAQQEAEQEEAVKSFEAYATAQTEPGNLINEQTIIVNGEAVDGYVSPYAMEFGRPEDYFALPGIAAFRGNNYRNGASYGTANVANGEANIVWQKETSALQAPDGNVWTGSGWTGQPLIAQWPLEQRQSFSYMYDWAKTQETLTEVIYATMDGYVYFLELETGKPTRDPLFLGFTFKGAGSLDPRGWPILYVGAGYESSRGAGRVLVVNLCDGTIMYEFGAADGYANRTWSMYDASPLYYEEGDELIYPGENGLLYIIQLNTSYNMEEGIVGIAPDEPVRWRYNGVRTGDKFWVGVEASPVIWTHYLYMADNGGNLMCMDLRTLKLVWVQDVLDDTNCTPVLECEDGHPYLYISTSFHAGWRAAENSTATIPVWKIDALSGEVVWQHDYTCFTQSGVSGGVQGTMALGKNDLKDLVFVPVSRCGDQASAGVLAALNKKTGETVWEFPTVIYSWSSPVDFYDENGKGYLIYCTSGGFLYLLDGATGEKLAGIDLDGNIEASPAMFNDMVVVGHRSQKIFGIQIS